MRATFSELAAAVGRCERCTLDYSAHPHRNCDDPGSDLLRAAEAVLEATIKLAGFPHLIAPFACEFNSLRAAVNACLRGVDSPDYRGDTTPPVLECDECGEEPPQRVTF